MDPKSRVAQQPIIRSKFPGNCLKIKKMGRNAGGFEIGLCRSAIIDKTMGIIDT